MKKIVDEGKIVEQIGKRVMGSKDIDKIMNKVKGEVIVEDGRMVEEKEVEIIEKDGIKQIRISQEIKCEKRKGV